MGYFVGIRNPEGTDWGAKLQTLYPLLNISNKKFARGLGVTLSALEKVESGEKMPSQYFLDRIYATYHVNPSWMTGEVEEPVLLSDQAVRSGDDAILKRLSQLQGNMGDHDFSRKTGIGVRSLQQIRNGERSLSEKSARLLARTCSVSVEWILCGDEVSKNYPCNERMIDYLNQHEDLRKLIYTMMDGKPEQPNAKSDSEREQQEQADMVRRLQEAYNSLGVEEADVAAMTKTKESKVHTYLTGETPLTPEFIHNFSKAYAVSMNWIRTGHGRKYYQTPYDERHAERQKLAKRLKTMRKTKELKQTDMAKAAYVSKSFISLMETGRTNMPESFAERLETVYGVRASWLLKGEGEMWEME